MREKGQSKAEVLSKLKVIWEDDLKYEDGKILCSMCTKPHSAAKSAHQMFLSSNLGDPGLFQGSQRIEREVVDQLSELLSGKSSVGFVVSGGTEANLLALLAARNLANNDAPEVIVPESAHFSFNKICNLLKLKRVQVNLNRAYQVDPSLVERNINKNTIAIVGTAGTAELGAVDPINRLSELAVKHDLYLHVDAAFGGLIIPFLKEDNSLIFDFRLDGVKSITIDPHKMGMSTIPAGGVLFRDSTLLDCLKTETPYLTEPYQYTFVGTRTGASAAATWAVFNKLGREGFRKHVQHCMRLTEFLASKLESNGFELVVKPTLNVVAFRGSNSKALAERLQQKGWMVSFIPRLDCIRIVVMPHLQKQHAVAFLEDLR